jgi:hypothetical protein
MIGHDDPLAMFPARPTRVIVAIRNAAGALHTLDIHAPECPRFVNLKAPLCICLQTVVVGSHGLKPDLKGLLPRIEEVTGVEPIPVEEDWV